MYSTIVILCLECFHCYVIIIDCLFTSFDMLYFSTDGCINKSLTYLLTYLLTLALMLFYVELNSEIPLQQDLSSQIRPDPAPARFGKVKSGTSLILSDFCLYKSQWHNRNLSSLL